MVKTVVLSKFFFQQLFLQITNLRETYIDVTKRELLQKSKMKGGLGDVQLESRLKDGFVRYRIYQYI